MICSLSSFSKPQALVLPKQYIALMASETMGYEYRTTTPLWC